MGVRKLVDMMVGRNAFVLASLALWALPVPARGGSSIEIGAGVDYRYVYYSFESYASSSDPRYYTDEAFRLFGGGVDAAWLFDVIPNLRIGPVASLGVTVGSYDAWVNDDEVGSGDGIGVRAQLAAQATYAFTPKLKGVARLGFGFIWTTLDPGPDIDPYRYEHDEEALAALGTLGVAYEFRPRLDLALLVEKNLGYFEASTDYRPTGYEPTALDYSTYAVMLRAVVRFGVGGREGIRESP
jgi:hypothetical protein